MVLNNGLIQPVPEKQIEKKVQNNKKREMFDFLYDCCDAFHNQKVFKKK